MVLLLCVLAGFGVRAYRALVISALFGFITALVWVLVVVPAVVGFALAMASGEDRSCRLRMRAPRPHREDLVTHLHDGDIVFADVTRDLAVG